MPAFAIGLPHGSEWAFIFSFFVFGPALLISALVSCMRNESSSGNTKVVWVLIILLVQFLGPLAYLLIRRPQRLRELGR